METQLASLSVRPFGRPPRAGCGRGRDMSVATLPRLGPDGPLAFAAPPPSLEEVAELVGAGFHVSRGAVPGPRRRRLAVPALSLFRMTR
eukprot:7169022-Pyramimonas_sp.AAC.1